MTEPPCTCNGGYNPECESEHEQIGAPMKLFLWTEVLTDYSDGVMFALANSVDEARELIKKGCDYIPDYELEKEPKIIDSPFGFSMWGGG